MQQILEGKGQTDDDIAYRRAEINYSQSFVN
jgi:hypothetical protein